TVQRVGEANPNFRVVRASRARGARTIVAGGSARAEGRARSTGGIHHLVFVLRPLRPDSLVPPYRFPERRAATAPCSPSKAGPPSTRSLSCGLSWVCPLARLLSAQ